jgi:hypothetical protein
MSKDSSAIGVTAKAGKEENISGDLNAYEFK